MALTDMDQTVWPAWSRTVRTQIIYGVLSIIEGAPIRSECNIIQCLNYMIVDGVCDVSILGVLLIFIGVSHVLVAFIHLNMYYISNTSEDMEGLSLLLLC